MKKSVASAKPHMNPAQRIHERSIGTVEGGITGLLVDGNR
jgi:uncharacterized membrane protein YccC